MRHRWNLRMAAALLVSCGSLPLVEAASQEEPGSTSATTSVSGTVSAIDFDDLRHSAGSPFRYPGIIHFTPRTLWAGYC